MTSQIKLIIDVIGTGFINLSISSVVRFGGDLSWGYVSVCAVVFVSYIVYMKGPGRVKSSLQLLFVLFYIFNN